MDCGRAGFTWCDVLDEAFAARIDSQHGPEVEVDWRRGQTASLPHSAEQLPSDLSDLCVRMTRDYGLEFSAMDLARHVDAGVLGSANTEGQKHFDHPALTGHDVEDGGALARAARQAWDLGDDPLPNLSSVVEHRAGLHLAVEPFDGAIAGLTARLDGVALALVDSSSPYGRQRFTIAHELCHYLRGEGSPMDDGDLLLVDRTIANTPGEERRANAFAAELLMPTAAVGRYARGRDLTDAVIVELQYVFGASLDALLWRLHNLGRLNEAQRELLSAAGARTLATRHGYAAEWQAGEALRGARRPPQRLFERALAAYSGGAVGLELLARLSGRTDLDAVRRELDDAGVPSSSSWWESDAPA